MKTIRLLSICLLLTGALSAATNFPGLQSIMTEAEWKRAGLDRLTPDQIGVIDAAVIRHHVASTRAPGDAPSAATSAAPPAATAAAPEPARGKSTLLGRLGLSTSRDDAPAAAPAAAAPRPPRTASAPNEITPARAGLLERFGLSKGSGDDWRSQPPLVAHFVMWQGANRFLLDNGQVWEGLEQIIFELPPGREVIIEARPLNGFAMKLDDRSAVVRVQRVK
ncbi:MAG TPA: hypothetical protein VM029_10085 [Opitutaceae bacterium]|nr:hypothetical protein [Opitutaceae bacterium]